MYYLLTFICGLFGVLALLRSVERLAHDGPVLPAQLFVAVLGLSLAVLCLRKARSARKSTDAGTH